MSITIRKKTYGLTNILLSAALLILYFLGVSAFGVSLAVPFAFLWLMWTLQGIKSGLEKQKEEMEKIAAR